MSTFQLPKSNGRISKKQVSVGVTASVLKSISPASTASSSTLVNQYASEPVVSKVVVEGEPVSFTQSNLDAIPAANSAGQAQGNKILLLDSNGSIANINEVNCTSITVGEVAISTNTSNAPAAAPPNDYLLDTTPGVAKSGRALVADTNLSISANEISANSLGGPISYKKEPSIGCITQVTELAGSEWSAIAWSVDLNLGVCVGNSLLATVTLSGASGVAVTPSESTLNLKTVVWCSWLGSFVANGPSGTFKSSDGVTWNAQSSAPNVIFTDMITYTTLPSNGSNSVVVACSDGACLFSSNGTTWTSVSVTGSWASVAVSVALNRLVLVGTNIRATTQLSTLSSTSVFTSGALTGRWGSVCGSSSGFVAMSSEGVNTARMTHSVNGVDWVSPTEEAYNSTSDLSLANIPIRGIKYFPERDIFFAITDDASPTSFFLFYSKDGLNWFPYRTEPSTRVIDIDYDPKTERFISLTGGFSLAAGLVGFKPAACVGHSGAGFTRAFQCNNIAYVSRIGRILYSNDCKQFARVTVPSTISEIREIAYSPTLNKYVGVGSYNAGGSGVCISDDGIVFTHVNVTPLGEPFSVCWFPNYARFVIVCRSIMQIMTSTNGLSWDTVSSPSGLVSTTDGQMVNVPGFGLTYRGQASVKFAKMNDTPTGITATVSSLSTTLALVHGSIAYANGRVYVVGVDGSVYSSADGVSFMLELAANSNQIGVTPIPELNTVAISLNNGSALIYNTATTAWDSVSAAPMSNINISAVCYVPGLKLRFCIASHIIGVSRSSTGGIATSIRNDTVGGLTFQSDPYAFTSIEAIDRVSVAMASRLVYSSSDLTNCRVYFSRRQNMLIRFGVSVSAATSSNGSTFTAISGVSGIRSMVEVGSRFYGFNGSSFVSFSSAGVIESVNVANVTNLFMKTYGVDIYYHNAGVITKGPVYVGSVTVARSAINLLDFAVKPLSTISTASGDIFVGVSSTGISFCNEFGSMSIVQNGDFRIVEYFPTLDMFIAGGVGQVGLSKDGITWELVPIASAIWMCFRYVPELRCIVAGGGNGLVGVTVDGRYWRTTVLNNTTANVVDLDYVASHGTFALSIGTGGRFTDIVELSRNRLQIATNSYFRNNKLVMFPSTSLTPFREPTHVLETNNDILVTDGTTASTFLSVSTNGTITTLQNDSRNLNIVNHNGSSTGLCLSGNLVTASANSINSVFRGLYATNGRNVFLEVNQYGAIVGKSLDCTGLNLQPINEASGVLVCKSNGAISVDSIESSEIDLGSCVIVDKSIAPTSLWQYPTVAISESDAVSGTSRVGIAYSPTLDMYIAVFIASGSRYNAYISVDGGKSWAPNSNIHHASATVAVTADTRNHFMWVSAYNAFILATGGMLRYSYDGYNWFGVTVPYLITGHIFIPPTGGIGVCGTNICTVAAGLDFTVAANWTTQFTSTTWRCLEWSSAYNTYVGLNNSFDGLYTSASLTVAPTRVATYTTVTSFAMLGNAIYIAANGTVYKKTDVSASTGSSLLTLSSVTLTNVKAHDTNTISVCSNLNGDTYYSTNGGTNWSISAVGAVNKGVASSSNMSYHLLKNGDTLIWTFRSSIMISGKPSQKQRYSARSLESIASNKIGGDGLVNTSLYSNMFFYKKSTTYKMEAIAYNGSKTSPKYLIAGLNTVMTCPRLKYQHLSTITTVTGAWTDALWDSSGNRWLIMSSSDVMSSTDGISFTSTGGGMGGLNIAQNPKTGVFVMSMPTGYAYSTDCSSWVVVTLNGTWNNVKYDTQANTWVLSGLNQIAYAVSGAVSSPWTVVNIVGNWRDAAFGKNTWSLVGDRCIARSIGGFQKFTLKACNTLFSGILYCMDYKRFYAFSNASNVLSMVSNLIQSSLDGIHWMSNFYPGESHTTLTQQYSMRHLYFFDNTMQFAAPLSVTGGSGLDYLMCTDYADAGTTQLVADRLAMAVRSNRLEIGNVSLAGTVSKDLSVYADSAAKPGTSTWTITSDERVKEDIQPADLDRCYDVVKSIPLHYYKWNDDFIKSMNVVDNHKLGWLAQDVQSVFPKAVYEMEEPFLGVDKCLTLQTDQLIASMWGCIQKLDKQVKQLEDGSQ